MIPTIGIMVGFYIITRMVEISMDKVKGRSLKGLAAVTAVITVLCMFSLISSSGTTQTF